MRILDVSPITDSAEFPIKKGTLQFIQDAYKELSTAILTAILSPAYNPSTVYVLYGVRNTIDQTTNPGVYQVTPGVVFYQGEVFFVDATNFTAAGVNVGLFQISKTQYQQDADPVTFTDESQKNVHNIRQVIVVQGASGSGIADFSAAAYPNFQIPAKLNLTAPSTGTFAGNQIQLSGVYPDLVLNVPPSSNLNPVLGAGNVHVGDVPSGGVTIVVTFGSGGQCPVLPAGTQYYVMPVILSEGTPAQDTTNGLTVIKSTMNSNGFSFRLQELANGTSAISIDYIVFKKS